MQEVPLEQMVYNEADLLKLLDIDKRTLDALRLDKGFPAVRLTARARVYLADEVLGWLKEVAKRR